MTAYYNILETIKNQLLVDEFVNTVTQGDIFDVDLNKQTIFPLSHIMVNNVTRESNVLRFNVTVMCMDIVDKSKTETTDIFLGNDNEQDVLNTQLAVVSRMLEIFDRGGNVNTFRMDGDPSIEPFTERFENYLAGWSCTFDILVANDMTVCGPLITPAGCADANVENSDATYTDTVASGATLILPDSQINVNGVNEGNVVSVKTIDVNLTDGTNPVNPNDVTLVGNTLTIEVTPPPPCFPYRGAQFIIDPNDTEHGYSGLGSDVFSVVGTRRGTLFNGASKVGSFFNFDGIDDYLEIEAGRYAIMQDALTFHGWINVVPVLGGTYVFLIPTTFSVGNGSFYVHYNGTTNQLILRGYNFSNVLTSYALGDVLAGNSGVNIMISVAHDFDSSTTYTYVNGVLFSTTTGVDLNPETGNLARRIARVGGVYSNQRQGFTAMYNDLHTLAEVQAIFELTKADYGY